MEELLRTLPERDQIYDAVVEVLERYDLPNTFVGVLMHNQPGVELTLAAEYRQTLTIGTLTGIAKELRALAQEKNWDYFARTHEEPNIITIRSRS